MGRLECRWSRTVRGTLAGSEVTDVGPEAIRHLLPGPQAGKHHVCRSAIVSIRNSNTWHLAFPQPLLTRIRYLPRLNCSLLAPGVTVARLTLDQLVKVQILGGQLGLTSLPMLRPAVAGFTLGIGSGWRADVAPRVSIRFSPWGVML